MENNPKMTPEEMNLALCEMLPELICLIGTSEPFAVWNSGKEINWSTEGLQVCHEAEKLLSKGFDEENRYEYMLHRVVGGDKGICWRICHATFEQRREALCRVKFPERF